MFVCYRCYIMIEFMLMKEIMLIKKMHQNSMISVTIGIS